MTSSRSSSAPAVSRAAVVKGLAWGAPAVAAVAAAPFAAASPMRYDVDFSQRQATSTGKGTPVPVTTQSTAGSGTMSPSGATLTLTRDQGIRISFGRDASGRPLQVTDLTFTIADLTFYDNNGTAGVKDQVGVTPAATTIDSSNLASANPFTAVAKTTGSATVRVAGPVSELTITLTNGGRGKADPQVVIRDMSFTADLAPRA